MKQYINLHVIAIAILLREYQGLYSPPPLPPPPQKESPILIFPSEILAGFSLGVDGKEDEREIPSYEKIG